MISIQEFHGHVVEMYDDEVGQRFLSNVSGKAGVSYPECVSALKAALLNGATPRAPGFGRTNSKPLTLCVPEVVAKAMKQHLDNG